MKSNGPEHPIPGLARPSQERSDEDICDFGGARALSNEDVCDLGGARALPSRKCLRQGDLARPLVGRAAS